MINDFNNGAEGWTDWNVLLDESGGPNHVQNFCFAPVHADTKTGRLTFMNSYYLSAIFQNLFARVQSGLSVHLQRMRF
jgi:glucosylceramidase